MKEKELTDEEIVKALECCVKGETCKPCPYFIKRIDCVYHRRAEGDALDLIRRLQYGYSSASKASEEWKEKYEKERKENAEQNAEIERLKKSNEELYYSGLNENTARLGDMKKIERLEDKNAELQKQVDELKEINDIYKKAIESDIDDYNFGYRTGKEQAVKDTAKEIYQELCGHGTTYVKKLIKERYAVEVE